MKNKFSLSMTHFFIIIFSLFFLVGCGAKPTPSKKVTPPPKWVYAVPPSDTATKMYGLGIAHDRKSAIHAALNDMISRLGITIKSSYNSSQTVNNFYSNLVVKDSISANVSKIKINNYKVIKSYKISYKEFAVMIETNKQIFIHGLKSTLDEKIKNIEQRYSFLRDKNSLVQYNEKKKLSLESASLMTTILILTELDPSFDKNHYIQFVTRKQKEFLEVSNKLRFYVSGGNKSISFVNIIKNYLAGEGFTLVNSKSNAINIDLSVKDNIDYGNISIAVLTININVYENNKRIGGNTKIIKERYNHSIENVYKMASIHFKQYVKKLGINRVIGINLDNSK